MRARLRARLRGAALYHLGMRIRPATAADLPAILALNAESEWAMTPLDAGQLDELIAITELALVAAAGTGQAGDDGTPHVPADQATATAGAGGAAGGEVIGFALGLAPGQPYDSANYRWFEERYASFVYLDRIAIGVAHRRRGVGAALYDVMEIHAGPSGRMLCEVNLVPPNEGSLAFHRARGYDEVGTLEHPGGKVVVMLAKELGT